jgi:hypothetical protein
MRPGVEWSIWAQKPFPPVSLYPPRRWPPLCLLRSWLRPSACASRAARCRPAGASRNPRCTEIISPSLCAPPAPVAAPPVRACAARPARRRSPPTRDARAVSARSTRRAQAPHLRATRPLTSRPGSRFFRPQCAHGCARGRRLYRLLHQPGARSATPGSAQTLLLSCRRGEAHGRRARRRARYTRCSRQCRRARESRGATGDGPSRGCHAARGAPRFRPTLAPARSLHR